MTRAERVRHLTLAFESRPPAYERVRNEPCDGHLWRPPRPSKWKACTLQGREFVGRAIWREGFLCDDGQVVRRVSHFSPVAATPNLQLVLQIRVSGGSIEDSGTQGTC